ncbi:hypothetical protein D1872_244360 [compost metagenome]
MRFPTGGDEVYVRFLVRDPDVKKQPYVWLTRCNSGTDSIVWMGEGRTSYERKGTQNGDAIAVVYHRISTDVRRDSIADVSCISENRRKRNSSAYRRHFVRTASWSRGRTN